MPEKPKQQKSPSIREVALSVIAAAFGVQNSSNSKRDFTTGKPVVFVVAGIIFTILFVLTIIGVVNLILGA